jgi:predicted dehydrogenase
MEENSVRARAVCRVGFVGTGGVAARHAGILATFDDAEIVAVTDLDHDRGAAFAHAHGGRAVPDVAALIEAGVDAVYVCVPPFAHGKAEMALADAEVALFVEKPLALDERTAQQISDRIAAAGVVSRVGHHWRCAESVRQARELLAGRTVRQVSGYWLDTVPPVPWWTDRARSGGPLVEQAVHVLDLARVLVGEVDEVYALSAGPPESGTTDVAISGVLRFAGGAVGTVSTTCALAGKLRAGLEVVADGLAVGVGEDRLHVGDGISTRTRRFDPGTARRAADREFLDAVRDGGSAPSALGLPDHAEAMHSHRLACALARSVTTRAPEVAR